MKKTKRIISAVLAAIILCSAPVCLADGYETIAVKTRTATRITYGGAYYTKLTGTYKTKNAVAYTVTVNPNAHTRFVAVNGGGVYGRKTLSNIISAYKGEGRAVAAINADFFASTTGVPLGVQITDGVLVATNNAGYEREDQRRWSIGFRKDGTAMIGVPDVTVSVDISGTVIKPDRVNSFPATQTTLITSDYGDRITWDGGYAHDVIVLNVADKLKIGGTLEGTFDSYIAGTSEQPRILPGKMYIVTSAGLLQNAARGKKAGDTVTITVSESGGWGEAVNAVGGGNLLINNGAIRYPSTYDSSISTLTTSRSAIGVKENGTVVLYLAERDRDGKSSGVKLEAVAQALYDMGCKYAINFDGGGSSMLAVSTGGACTVRNACQDGGERRISNALLLVTGETAPGVVYDFDDEPDGIEQYSGKSVIDVSADKTNVYTGAASLKMNYRFAGDTTVLGYAFKNPIDLSAYSRITLSTLTNGGAELYAVLGTGSGEFKREIPLSGDGWRKSEIYVGDAKTLIGFALQSQTAMSGSINIDRLAGYAGYTLTDNEAPSLTATLSGGKLTLAASDAPYASGVDRNGYTVTAGEEQIEVKSGVADLTALTGNKIVRVIADALDVFGNRARQYAFVAPAGYTAPSPYKDLKDGTWDAPYVRFCTENKIVDGFEDGTFRGSDKVTRAQFCTMLVRLKKLNINKYSGVRLPYDDADKIPRWAVLYVKAAYAEGIMTGSKTGTGVSFYAADPITRQEAAVAAARAITPDPRLSTGRTYRDEAQIAAWAKESVALMSEQGLLAGDSDGRFYPKRTLSRSEAAAIMARMS